MTESENLHVIVAGGGIGGLALAQGLRRAGVSVAVYERDRHRTDRLQGFRMHVNPHGSQALHDLLPAELFDALVATSGKNGNEYRFLTERGTELLHLDEQITTGGATDPARSHHGVSRITLRQVLLSGLDDVVQYDAKFDHYERDADGRIVAHFTDGSTATGDVLVGADGGRSAVRRQYLPHARRVDTGIVTVAGKYALTEENRRVLPSRFLLGPCSVVPRTRNGMFIAPHEIGDVSGRPAGIGGDDGAAGLHPGALFDNTRPYVFWAYAAKRADYPVQRPLESLTAAELHALVRELTAGWGPDLRTLVDRTDTETVTVIPIGTAEPVEPWPTTDVTLIGDAIHSMTPFRGIGANTALRDAQLLCRHLVAARNGQEPLLDAIHAYETEMLDYGFAAVRNSLTAAKTAVSGNRFSRAMGKVTFRAFNAVPPLKRTVFAGFGDS